MLIEGFFDSATWTVSYLLLDVLAMITEMTPLRICATACSKRS
jgi:hypothetical protein